MQAPRPRGFTLIEMVIVIVVIGIMAAVLSPLALSSLRAYDAVLGDVVVLDKLRYATERLAREVREVNYVDSVTGFAFASGGMGPSTMQFTRSYYDANGNVLAAPVVTAAQTGSTVTLAYSTSVISPTPILTDEVDANGLTFVYLDKNGCDISVAGCAGATGLLNPKDVRTVQITLTLRHNGNPYAQSTQVELKRYAGS